MYKYTNYGHGLLTFSSSGRARVIRVNQYTRVIRVNQCTRVIRVNQCTRVIKVNQCTRVITIIRVKQ